MHYDQRNRISLTRALYDLDKGATVDQSGTENGLAKIPRE
jgi:hypothetical protein